MFNWFRPLHRVPAMQIAALARTLANIIDADGAGVQIDGPTALRQFAVALENTRPPSKMRYLGLSHPSLRIFIQGAFTFLVGVSIGTLIALLRV